MATSDPSAAPIAADLLACLAAEVAKVASPPRAQMLRPGLQTELLLSQARDECCEGLAWVRPDHIYPSTTFPLPDERWDPTEPVQWAVTLEMGVARCAPTSDITTIPSADAWNAVTEAILDDAAAMRRTICAFTALPAYEDRMILAGGWTPLAVEGGCVGGAQLVTIAFPACDCD